jgi:hypothetical protein
MLATIGHRHEKALFFQAGRDALSDQHGVVTGVRQRTGTLLAAHALVASFLGVTTVKVKAGAGWRSWRLRRVGCASAGEAHFAGSRAAAGAGVLVVDRS